MIMSDLLVRTILRLYPANFRRRYGAELVEALKQQRAALRAGSAPGAVLSFWLRTLMSTLSSAMWVRRRRVRAEPPVPTDGSSKRGPAE